MFLRYDVFRWGWSSLFVLLASVLFWIFAFHALWTKRRDRASCILGVLWTLASLRACINLVYATWGGCGLTAEALAVFLCWNLTLAVAVPFVECGTLTILVLLWSAAREDEPMLTMPTNMPGVVAGLLAVVLWFIIIFGTVFGLPYH